MKVVRNKFSIALGIAFLLQSIAPLVSGAFLFDPLIDKGDIFKTMTNLTSHSFTEQLSFFLDVVTMIGIFWLGVLLYNLLNKLNKVWALTGLALYILEAVMHFTGKVFGNGLLRISELYTATADASLVPLAQIFLQINKFLPALAMIPFGIGAILLYALMLKSKALPAWLMIWGLVSSLGILIGVPLMAYGVPVPLIVAAPYVPFEFFTGAFILIRGLKCIVKD